MSALDELRDASDEALMALCREGYEPAFTTLYLRHKDAVVRFAGHMLRDRDEALDVFQDTFRYVFTKIPTYEPQAKFTTLLFRVVRSLCVSILRKQRRVHYTDILDDTLPPPEEVDPGEAIDRQAAREGVDRAMQDLPEIFREVLLLRLANNLTCEEIAEVIDVPVGTVKSRIHLGVQRLRIALGLLRRVPEKP